MPRNEDGEFELVVGNKQLLSIIFILMVLFGVVFSMGYFVGRANTAPEPPAQQAANQASPRPQAAGENVPAATPDSTPDAALAPGEARLTPTDKPAETTPVATTPVASASPAATPPPPVATPRPAAADGPQPGQTFLQVAAVRKPQADQLVDLLKEKGFRALTTPVAPGSPQYRTLVGPLKNPADLARIKAQLEDAGFKPIVKRY